MSKYYYVCPGDIMYKSEFDWFTYDEVREAVSKHVKTVDIGNDKRISFFVLPKNKETKLIPLICSRKNVTSLYVSDYITNDFYKTTKDLGVPPFYNELVLVPQEEISESKVKEILNNLTDEEKEFYRLNLLYLNAGIKKGYSDGVLRHIREYSSHKSDNNKEVKKKIKKLD